MYGQIHPTSRAALNAMPPAMMVELESTDTVNLVSPADAVDQQQRVLTITDADRTLWDAVPDPVAIAHAVSFTDADEDDLAPTRRVLKTATQKLLDHLAE